MKKLILLLSIIALFSQSSFAQTGGLNFQGVARNATGAVLANQKINLKFSILKTTETGAVEYTETKEATTNAQGIFAVVVGEVNATSFAAVDWKITPKFLKVEMDATGGTSFVAMGTTRLQNVPFAYYANGVNANNIDGTISVAKGGTGATDAAVARTNLGLVIGTNVQAPLTAGTDYLTPSGNAATSTKLAAAKKINGVDFDGSSDITIPTAADASTLSGTVAINKGGTGATTAADARANLGLVIGTNVQAPLIAGTDYLTPTGNAATATLSGNITATSNSSLNTLPNLTTVGTISSGNWSGTTIPIIKGGTGATNATAALTNLGAESTSNKSTDITLDANSLTKYPSVKTIKDYVDTRVITGVSSNTDMNITSVNGLQLGRGTGTNTNSVAVGKNVLRFNTTGTSNTAIGESALFSNTTGGQNAGFGANSLPNNTIGNNNTATGNEALYKNTAGNNNTATGHSALWNNTTGDNNSALGYRALNSNTTGVGNTGIGRSALSVNTTGNSNTAIGDNSNVASNNLSNATALGNGATVSASNTIQLGNNAVTNVKTSGAITAAGYKTPTGTSSQYLMADGSVSSGSISGTSLNGLSLGLGAGSNTSNIAVGANALNSNTTGNTNVAIGGASLNRNSTGNQNVAIGTFALFFNKSKRGSVAIGTNAMLNADDDANNPIWTGNTAVGWVAMEGSSTAANNTGVSNTALGSQSLGMYSSGSQNVGAGSLSLYRNTSGSSNTGLGFYALGTNTTGSNNTAIGYEADVSTGTLNNATALGNGARVSASNTIQLGNTAVTNIKSSGTLTLGAITYPNTLGQNGQILTSVGSGVLTWTNLSSVYAGTGNNSIAIGVSAGSQNQGEYSIALGGYAGNNTQGYGSIALGQSAGRNNQSTYSIALGESAGYDTQGNASISLGQAAGRSNQGQFSIALGQSAGRSNQGQFSIAIGNAAGYDTQGAHSIAIGESAGTQNQGEYSIALGVYAGGINQPANSIILNSSGGSLSAANSGFFVKPIRAINNIRGGVIMYNNTTSELYNSTSLNLSGTITAGAITYPNTDGLSGQVLTSTGAGTLTWTTPQPDYAVGINLSLGGYVIYVTPNGKHGLVVPLTDQTPDVNNLPNVYNAINIVSDPSNYDVNAKNFTDWRLPTKYELNLMYTRRNEIGNFVNITGRGGYWSSTDYGNNVKYYLFFLDNNSNLPTSQQDIFGGNIRAIRSF